MDNLKEITYSDSGVDIEKEEIAINQIISNINYQRKGIGQPLGGHYAGLIEFGNLILVLCTDGVGSKVKIASKMKKWDTIGIDCIAMNVNDAICVGAEPIAFVDYLAIDDPKPEITKEIGKGLSKGAELSNISIVGGETASLPDIINGFDLAGTCLGFVKKEKIVTGQKITHGDIIIGLKSSGIHSNGYSLVRKVMKESKISYEDTFPNKLKNNKKIGYTLLTPTNIYVKEILNVLKSVNVHGLAHITGGGLKNFLRLNKKVKFIIDDPFKPQNIFNFIKGKGHISNFEMYKTFNMGMGFAIIIDENDVEESIKIIKKSTKIEVKIVGKIEKGKGVFAPTLGINY